MNFSFFLWLYRGSWILIVCAIFFIGMFLFRLVDAVSLPSLEKNPVALPESIKSLIPVTELESIVKTRDLFSLSPALVQKDSVNAVDLSRIPYHLKVVAIVLGVKPQVVIEDLDQKKTFFVEPGQGDGPFRIERFDKKQIYLNYQGTVYAIVAGGS